ncbi:GFA family protein [Acinetobacter sp. ULE_I010]|uniref:GFA family protein n=1 Tax=Acinetobacter sp. ULE_I010 TaxID=3373065 RepID=UPI003AF5C9A7
MINIINQEVSCSCGQSKFIIHGKLLTRFICHCQICQKIYKDNSADILVFSKNSITLMNYTTIQFKKHRLPPAVNRGVCLNCLQPVVGFMSLIPFVNIAFVPAMHLKQTNIVLKPSAHVFYHRRIQDSYDDFPKLSGYLRSQLFLSKQILINIK